MRIQRMKTGSPLPKALSCGMLEDGGRVLFLCRRDETGIERIEIPCILVFSGRSAFAEIKGAFQSMTGIDGEVHEVVMESRHNAGTRKRKIWVPCLVFKITARNRSAKPGAGYSGFKWLPISEAIMMKLGRNGEWLRSWVAKEQSEKNKK